MKKVLFRLKAYSVMTLLLFSALLSVAIAPIFLVSTGIVFVVISILLFIASIYLPVGILGINTFDLLKDSIENPGGCSTQWYWAFWDDILTFPTLPVMTNPPSGDPADMAVLTGTFIMKSTCQFWKGYGTLDTVSVEDDMVGPLDSKSFKNVFKCSYPSVRQLLAGWLRMVSNKSLVIIASDSNGTMRVVGNSLYGANLATAKSSTGAKVEDGNKSELEFDCYGPCPSPIYTGVVPLTPAI